MSQISQLNISIAVSICCLCLCHHLSHSFPHSSATKSRDLSYNFVIGWCDGFFHQQERVFFCLQTLPDSSHRNVSEKTWRTILIITPVLLSLSTQIKKVVYSLNAAPIHEVTEAPSRCYIILNQSRDLIIPA